MDTYMIPFILRDTLLCLVFLVGLGTGILAITRKQQKVGALVLAGFLLLGLDPLAEMAIFNVISPAYGGEVDYLIFNWTYVCISAPATIFGALSLLVAIKLALQPGSVKQTDNSPSNEPVMMDSESKIA